MTPVDYEFRGQLDFQTGRKYKNPWSSSHSTPSSQDVLIRNDKMCSQGDDPPSSTHQKEASCANATKASVVDDLNCNTISHDLPYEEVLHNVCQLFPHSEEVVQIALGLYPTAIAQQGRRVRQSTGAKRRKISHAASYLAKPTVTFHRVQEEYTLPINIALAGKANDKVLDVLISESPEALAFPDGASRSASLSIALKCKARRHDDTIIRKLIRANSECVRVCDSKGNNPLHIACATGASQGTVKEICQRYPQAVVMKNMNGQTPLDVAIRAGAHLVADHTVDFLTRKMMEIKS